MPSSISSEDLTQTVLARPHQFVVAINNVSGDLVKTPMQNAEYGEMSLTATASSTVIDQVYFNTLSDKTPTRYINGASGDEIRVTFASDQISFQEYVLYTEVTNKDGGAEEKYEYIWPDPELPAPTTNLVVDNTQGSFGKAILTIDKETLTQVYGGADKVVDICGFALTIRDGSNADQHVHIPQPADTESTVTYTFTGLAPGASTAGSATATGANVEQNLLTKVMVRALYVNNSTGSKKLETSKQTTFVNFTLGDELAVSSGTPAFSRHLGVDMGALLKVDNNMNFNPDGSKNKFTISNMEYRFKATENWATMSIPQLTWATNNLTASIPVVASGIVGTAADLLKDFRVTFAYGGKTESVIWNNVTGQKSPSNLVKFVSAGENLKEFYAEEYANLDNAALGNNPNIDYSNLWLRPPGLDGSSDSDLKDEITVKLASQADICASGLDEFYVSAVFLGICGDTNNGYDQILRTQTAPKSTDASANAIVKFAFDGADISGQDVSDNVVGGLLNNGVNAFVYRVDVSNDAVKTLGTPSAPQRLLSCPLAVENMSVYSLNDEDPTDNGVNVFDARIGVKFDVSGGPAKQTKFPGFAGAAGNAITKTIIKIAPSDSQMQPTDISALNQLYKDYIKGQNNQSESAAGQAAYVKERKAINELINAGKLVEVNNPLVFDPLDNDATENEVIVDGLYYGANYTVNVYNETSALLRSPAATTTITPAGEYMVKQPTYTFYDVSAAGSLYDVSLSSPAPDQSLYKNTINNIEWSLYNYDVNASNNYYLGSQVGVAVDTHVNNEGTTLDTSDDKWQVRFNSLTKGNKYRLKGTPSATGQNNQVANTRSYYFDLILTTAPEIKSLVFDGTHLHIRVDTQNASFTKPSWVISDALLHSANKDAIAGGHALDITDLLNAETPSVTTGEIDISVKVTAVQGEDSGATAENIVVIASNAMGTDVSGSNSLANTAIYANA